MKEFIPYEQALELKELGFDEPCFAWYAENKVLQVAPETYKKWTTKPCNNTEIVKVFNKDCVTAPLYQQVFRWFREKHGLHAVVDINISDEWYFLIFNLNAKRNAEVVKKDEYYNTYEEAELACLKKLIEIVKKK